MKQDELDIRVGKSSRRWLWQRGYAAGVMYWPETLTKGYTKGGAMRAAARKYDRVIKEREKTTI